jgi:hypothetical protein
MKVRVLAVCTLILALAVPASFAADAPSVKAGKWQWTMQMDIPGMPFKVPPVKVEHCVTPEDAKSAVPSDQNGKDCKASNPEVDGNTYRWTVDCPKQKMTAKGEITYSDDTMTGELKMNSDGQESSMKYTGKWLGSCSK